MLQTTNAPLEGGVYFLLNGVKPQVVMMAIKLDSVTEGQILDCRARAIVSSRANQVYGTPPWNYPGYSKAPAFVATQLFLWNKDPAVNPIYDNTGTPIGVNSGEDINPDGMPFCYTNPSHSRLYQCGANDADGNPRWIVFVAWCSSVPATSSDYLLWEPTECELQVSD